MTGTYVAATVRVRDPVAETPVVVLPASVLAAGVTGPRIAAPAVATATSVSLMEEVRAAPQITSGVITVNAIAAAVIATGALAIQPTTPDDPLRTASLITSCAARGAAAVELVSAIIVLLGHHPGSAPEIINGATMPGIVAVDTAAGVFARAGGIS